MFTKEIILKNDLTQRYLRDYLFKFFRETNFKTNYYYVLTKVFIDQDSIIRTLGYKTLLDVTNRADITKYINDVTKYFLDHKDKYHPKADDKVVIYALESSKVMYTKKMRNLALNKNFDTKLAEGIVAPFNIPFNTMYNSWGDLKRINSALSIIENVIFNPEIKSIQLNKLDYNQTSGKVIFNNDKTINFIDTAKELDYIKRVFSGDESVFYFDQNKPFFSFDSASYVPKFELDKNGKPTGKRTDIIQPLKPADVLDTTKYITFDTETYLENGVFKMLCICFGGKDNSNNFVSHSFYRGDYKSNDSLLKAAFDTLLSEQYHGKRVYIHNGAKFDLNFLVNYLLTRKDIELTPVYKDGTFICLNVHYSPKYITDKGKKRIHSFNHCIGIRDSLLLLPSSLSKLGKAFNVETPKDIYPYDFPTITNLKYNGAVPSYKNFDPKKVSLADYNEYCNRFINNKWNLKNETIKYCINDCISLYQVIENFANLIYNKFQVDMFECPTIPSLAFRIFRINYLGKNVLPNLETKIYDDLVKAYFGGHVDLYIPKGPIYPKGEELTVKKLRLLNIPKLIEEKGIDWIKSKFKTIKHYDINSLFPSAMKSFKFPTDIIGSFIGDIRSISAYVHYYNDNLGIYKVKVKAPNIKHPLLPIRIGLQLLYPYGDWTGWYFSEEIKNAEKYGYEFEILGGYIFDSTDLFSSYIDELYQLKENSNKGGAMYLISKLLLNSLYGRLALSPHILDYSFWSKEYFNKQMKDTKIKDTIQDYEDFKSHYLVGFNNNLGHVQTNIAVGLAITAYSRIIMSQFKNHKLFNIFYSDTDSLFVDKHLPTSFVDNKKLGLYKLEAEYLLFIAIGPKVYGAMDIFGNEYTKVKGFKNQIDLENLESLLNKDTVQKLIQQKWFKSMKEGKISIKMSPYDLKPNNNKRITIYENNYFVNTENVFISNNSRVSKDS